EAVLLASIAALTITPYGTQLAIYPFHVASSLPVGVANVAEWQSMPFDMLGGKIFLALVLGFFVAQMALRFPMRLEELVLFLGGVGMACMHIRFLLVFVPFFAPVLVVVLAEWIPPYDRTKDKFALNAALMAALVVAMVHYFPSQKEMEKVVAEQFPVDAVAYLRGHEIPRPVFNSYNFGGYLVYAHEPVFVDGRAYPYE